MGRALKRRRMRKTLMTAEQRERRRVLRAEALARGMSSKAAAASATLRLYAEFPELRDQVNGTYRQRLRGEFIPREDKAAFRAYLASPEWQALRRRVWARDKGVCAVCGTTEGRRDVHHRTYARVGNERLSDLVLLCERHHYAAHAFPVGGYRH